MPLAILSLVCFAFVAAPQQPETPKESPAGKWVRCVAFSPDGAYLAAGVGEPKQRGLVALWDMASQKQLWSQEESEGVPALDFSPDGKSLLIGTYDRKAKLLDGATGRVLKVFEGHTHFVRAVAFAPDGKRVATGSWDKTVRLWDVATGKEQASFDWPADRLSSLSFSPNGRWLLAAGENACVWDVAAAEEKRSVKTRASSAVFAGDDWFLTGGGDGKIRLYNVATGEQPLMFYNIGGVERLAFSAKALIAETYSFGYNIELFSFTVDDPTPQEKKRIGEWIALLDDDDYGVREQASRDLLTAGFVAERELRRVAKESDSAEVRIRGRALREKMLTKSRASLLGHTDYVESMAFSPDGRFLVSASRDGTVCLWNISDFKESGALGSYQRITVTVIPANQNLG